MEISQPEVLDFCRKLTFHNNKTIKQVSVGSCGGLMVSALVYRIEQSRFKPWPGTLPCVLVQDTTLTVPLALHT